MIVNEVWIIENFIQFYSVSFINFYGRNIFINYAFILIEVFIVISATLVNANLMCRHQLWCIDLDKSQFLDIVCCKSIAKFWMDKSDCWKTPFQRSTWRQHAEHVNGNLYKSRIWQTINKPVLNVGLCPLWQHLEPKIIIDSFRSGLDDPDGVLNKQLQTTPTSWTYGDLQVLWCMTIIWLLRLRMVILVRAWKRLGH